MASRGVSLWVLVILALHYEGILYLCTPLQPSGIAEMTLFVNFGFSVRPSGAYIERHAKRTMSHGKGVIC